MNAETWGCFAQPPATVTHLRRRRLIKVYRRHREELVKVRQFVTILREVQETQARRRAGSH